MAVIPSITTSKGGLVIEFYWSLLSEIFLYLNQQKLPQDWVAVAIFPDRSIDIVHLSVAQQEMIASGRIVKIYLDEITDPPSVELAMVRLLTCPPQGL